MILQNPISKSGHKMLRWIFSWIITISVSISSSSDEAYAETGAEIQKQLKIVTLGTSLTSRGGWPTALETTLKSCDDVLVTVKVIALAGSTTDWAVNQIEHVINEKPDIVLIEFYANDAAINRWVSPSRSRNNFAKILDGINNGAPSARVIVMEMNPIFGLRGWMRPFLSSYISAHREEAELRDIEVIDFMPYWKHFTDEEITVAIPDGLHPSPEKATAVMAPVLQRYIRKGCVGQ